MKFMLLKIKLLIVLCLLPGSFLFAQQILDLDKALGIAMQNSPDIRATLLSLQRAQELLNAQEASLKTQFALTVDPFSYRNSREFYDRDAEWYTSKSYGSEGTFSVSQPILWTGGEVSLENTFGWGYNESQTGNETPNINRAFQNDLRLRVSQPLFTHNATKLALEELELQLENTNLQYAMQRLNLETQVTQYFYNVYMAQMSLSVAEDELANTKENYDLIVNKVEAGLSAREELYQAELDYAESESSVQDAQVSLENAKDQIKQYIGMDIYEEISVIADPQVQEVDVDLEKALEHALNTRMELRQYEIEIINAQNNIITTKDNDDLSGSLNLSMGLTGDNEELGNIYETPTKSPSVSLSFNVPIWDWGARKSRVRASELSLESTELDMEQEKISIIVELRSTYRSLQNQLNQITIAVKTQENAQLTYDLNQERYANGDLTGMDLKQYQSQLTTANNSYTRALINYKMELLSLKVQSLFDFEKNEPVTLDLGNE